MDPAPPYAVLFKTHFWDDFVESQFRRLQSRAGTDEVFVVVDETHGPATGITHDKVLRLTEDISEAEGFYQHPKGNSFWYNTDYPLYHFIGNHPEFKYVIVSEYDVAVNFDLYSVIQAMEVEGLEFICQYISTRKEEWRWRETAAPYYPDGFDYVGRLCCIAIFSKYFGNILKTARKDQFRRLNAGEINFPNGGEITWPFAEAFIGAEVERLSVANKPFSFFADTSSYDWWPPCHPNQAYNSTLDSIFHPVLSGERLVKSILKYPDRLAPETWLDPNSELRSRLDYEAPGKVVPALLEIFKSRKNVNALVSLWLELKDLGWNEHLFSLVDAILDISDTDEQSNIAVGKFAYQSSVSNWSRSQIAHEDADNAVNGHITGKEVFHTDREIRPWWSVDLGPFALVSEIVVYNRHPNLSARANYLSFWTSLNGRTWELLYKHASDIPFGGVDGNPLRIKLPRNAVTRFLRIETDGINCLHLDQVQVFGFMLAEITVDNGQHWALHG